MTPIEIIRKIECNKHDMTMRLRRVVLDPISNMDKKGAATSEYNESVGIRHKEILSLSKSIMEFYGSKWNDPTADEETQLMELKAGIERLNSEMVPQIKEDIIGYYRACLEHTVYFSNTQLGVRARRLMDESIDGFEEVCDSLISLDDILPMQHSQKREYNLLEVIQKVMDEINAVVEYPDAVHWLDSRIVTDVEDFQSHVLQNIRNNIELHAFGTSQFRNIPFYERKVKVEFAETEKWYVVKIYNNGTPFKGDPKRVFEYGYKFGEKECTGTGMYSMRKTMNELGGDVEFHVISPCQNPEFTTLYEIKINK